ncbi:MAG: TIGR02281 family clan AA aspartic protease [Alphaproteobacteria bacterium]|nr:TIGR02281 family clan AA aspartic protease [Alphaproteobacteria bacterium]
MSNRLGFAALLLILTAGGLFLLFQQFPGAPGNQWDQARLAQGILVLAFVGAGFVLGWNGSVGLALKQALTWAGLFVAVLTFYAYRQEFMAMGFRVTGVTLPTVPMAASADSGPVTGPRNGTVYLRSSEGGHFLADSAVNGTHVRFLVDTGASVVALNESDAERLRFDLKKLDFNVPIDTANGQNFAARVVLDEVRVGAISRKNVPAVILRDGLEQSLLGMSFLKSIGSFEMGDGVLILRD